DYRVLILNAHPEYWSHEMFRKVKAWVQERGGRLMYLGGNGLNCAVEFPDPHAMVCLNGDARSQKRRGLESRMHDALESAAALLVDDAVSRITANVLRRFLEGR